MTATLHIAGLALALGLLGSCRKSNSGGGSATDGPLPGTGCIQGTLVDGLKAAPVPVPPAQAGSVGLFVLVRDSLIAATPTADATTPQLAGDYNLCGIPLDQPFPLFVWAPGYQAFEGVVQVDSTASSRSPGAKADILKPYPVELVNIRLYPQNLQVKDLSVLVTHNGAALAGATVLLRPTGFNFLDPSGSAFLPPRAVRQQALTATSGADGSALFHAADLVLGGHYTYTVVPPNAGQDQTAVAAAEFVLGLRDGKDKTQPYQVIVDLARAQEDLALLSKSTDDADPEPTGKLVLYFNRAVEVVPGSNDGALASLSGNVTAQLADNVANNNQPDQLSIVVSNNVVTLKPVFKTPPNADPTKELAMAINYSGVQLRPSGAPGTLTTVTINDTVRFYR